MKCRALNNGGMNVPSTPQKIPVNRTLVGVIAFVCLAAAAGLWIVHGNDENWSMWKAGFTRAGLLMTAFWFALPSKKRNAAWTGVTPRTLLGLVLAGAAIVARPRVFLPVFAVFGVIAFLLRPRHRPGPARPDRDSWRERDL